MGAGRPPACLEPRSSTAEQTAQRVSGAPVITATTSTRSSVAVPKNQQKQQMSRERDSRRMPGWRDRLLPRSAGWQKFGIVGKTCRRN